MHHHIGLSGSVILTDPERFSNLFSYPHVTHIEIGEFPDEAAFQQFLELKDSYKVTFALHSPLYRNQSKYDLLEKVQFEPEQAWNQFEQEVKLMSEIGAEYVLVHFPYFKVAREITNTIKLIEDGLQRLHELQNRYSIPIVCEPKLGHHRSPFGIKALNKFPLEIWDKYGIKLCIDIGDYLLATGDNVVEYIKKWKRHIMVVHLHNVEFQQNHYIWIPVHPSHEKDGSHFKIRNLLEQLAKSPGVFFVFEHTPHSNPTETFVIEGIRWVKDILQDSSRN